MALQKVRDNLDGLSDDVKKEYVEKDGKFHLSLEGDDSESQIQHWQSKHRIAEEHKTKAERRAQELQDRVDDLHRGAVPKGDVEALEQSWKEKLETANTASANEKKVLEARISRATVGATAERLAQELFTAPELLVGEVQKRLAVEFAEDGEPVVRVKDKHGKPSAMTLVELADEIKADKKYESVLIGSKASGGGARGNKGGGGGPGGKKPHEYTEQERIELYRANPDEFKRLFPQ